MWTVTGIPRAVNRLWTVKDDVTEADTCPYEMIEYPGGLYAAAVSIDGDGESHNKVREKTAKAGKHKFRHRQRSGADGAHDLRG